MNSIWARWPTQALQGVYDRSLRHYHRLGKRIAAAMRRRARGPDHLVLNKAETLSRDYAERLKVDAQLTEIECVLADRRSRHHCRGLIKGKAGRIICPAFLFYC